MKIHSHNNIWIVCAQCKFFKEIQKSPNAAVCSLDFCLKFANTLQDVSNSLQTALELTEKEIFIYQFNVQKHNLARTFTYYSLKTFELSYYYDCN